MSDDVPQQHKADMYAKGWEAGMQQARRIVLRAESVGAAVAQIDGMVLDSRRSIKEYSALSRKLNGRSSGDGPAA